MQKNFSRQRFRLEEAISYIISFRTSQAVYSLQSRHADPVQFRALVQSLWAGPVSKHS